MKILFINAFFKEASTGKIVYDIMSELEKNSNYDMYACYGRGKKVTHKKIYRICSEFYAKVGIARGLVTGRYYSGRWFSTLRLIRYIKKVKPDIIHLHCLNSYVLNIYKLMDYLKKNNYKTVLTLHAEFMYTGTCGYAYDCEKWKTEQGCKDCIQVKENRFPIFNATSRNWKDMIRCFDGYDNLVLTSVSPWLLDRAKQSYIFGEYKNLLVLNGIDTSIFTYKADANNGNKAKKKTILHVTANFEAEIKGGIFVRQLAERLLKEGNKDIEFIVVGKTNNSDIPANVKTLGPIYDQNRLAELYRMADITLLTSKKETFSMICAESLCCGTPVVGFRAGAPEQISISEYSQFVEQADMNSLYESVMNWLNKDIDKSEISKKAVEIYSSETMAEKYREIYEEYMRGEIL